MVIFNWGKKQPHQRDQVMYGISGERAVHQDVSLCVDFYHNDYEGESPKILWSVRSNKGYAVLQANGEVVLDVWEGEEIGKEKFQIGFSLAKKRAEAVAKCFAECKVD